MKKVLVTGAAGYTGSHLCKRLKTAGYAVRGMVLPGQDTSGLRNQGIEVVEADLTQKDTLPAAVMDVHTVYHIAAVYREQNVPRRLFWEVNVGGTRNLLEASRAAEIERFVHCSTVGVQGEIDDPPANEEAPYKPGDYYQESKTEGEKLALRYFSEGMPVVVFRPVGIYGPGDTRFLKLFRMIYQGKFRMIGKGEVLYHLTYIDDLVDGILRVGETPGIEGEVFTLGGPRYTTLKEMVKIIARVLEVPEPTRHFPVWPVWAAGALCEFICLPFRIDPPLYRRRVDFFIKDRAFDIGKAKARLGYAPSVDLKEGLGRTAEWYRSNHLLD